MRLHPKKFIYFAPRNVREACSFLSKHKQDSKILAGGQSLVPLMKLRLSSPKYIVDVNRINGLSYIREAGKYIRIGALTRYAQLEYSPILRRVCPILAETVSVIGDPQVRNMGTIGGNIAHADPANDLPPTMIALDAEFISRRSSSKTGKFKADSFFKELFQTSLRLDEIITEIRIPKPSPRSGGAYVKFERKAGDFAVVSVATQLTLDSSGKCRKVGIGLGAVGETAIRAREAEILLQNKSVNNELVKEASSKASACCSPTSDLRGSAEFKRHLVGVLTQRALSTAFSRAVGGIVA
jgi:carbon-monoxide dehydrogenase medium subunit